MKKFAQRVAEAFKDESGQGATEYILLLVVVVAVVLLFKQKILGIINEKLNELEKGVQSVNTGTN